MPYYLAVSSDGRNFFGRPTPAVGVRVVFDPDLMFAARADALGRTVEHRLDGDEGLVIHDDPRDVFDWPCRLWEVGDIDGEIRLHPRNAWFRSRAVTVVRELPGWLIFGERGADVAAVIEQSRALTDAQVHMLAESVAGLPIPRDFSQQEAGEGPVRPIGHALFHVLEAVDHAARTTSFDLFAFDDEDGVHYLADETWQRARSVAFAAALAAGTVDAGDEATALARHWGQVVAPPT